MNIRLSRLLWRRHVARATAAIQSLQSVIRGQANEGARMCVGAAGRGSEPQCSQQPTAPKPVRAKGRTRHCSIPLQPQGTKPQPSSAQSWGASAAREADPASKKEPGKAAQCITACLYTREFGFRCIQQENGGGGGAAKLQLSLQEAGERPTCIEIAVKQGVGLGVWGGGGGLPGTAPRWPRCFWMYLHVPEPR